MTQQELATSGSAGAFGVNYALRPHKFVDRRVFIEIINRYSNYCPITRYAYVGLGSFAMEDHKLINASFGIEKLISLEIDADVLARQKFNSPLACITPTQYSTSDFVVKKASIFRHIALKHDANSIIWFDMTDHESLRAHLDTFGRLLEISQAGDVVRMTVDIDEKTFGRKAEGESLDELQLRRFEVIREQLGDELKPGARQHHLSKTLGIAQLVVYAFRLVAEKVFERSELCFAPLSITSYADGHRMLSITGALVSRDQLKSCHEKMDLSSVPGGVEDWDNLINIQIPQLTVWEKLSIDRELLGKSKIPEVLDFKIHESISTTELLKGYKIFQRFYPTFRHVLL